MEMDPAKNAKIDYSTLWGRLISHCKETLQIEADNAKRAKSFQTKNKLAEKERRRFDENLMKNIKNPNDIVISFQDFPFFLSDDTKSFMIASSGIHLDASLAEVRNLAPKSLFETPRILLLGPSEFYQEAVSKAIAKHFDARLLIVDLLSFSAFSLWGTTIKEAESSKRNSKKKIRLETHFFEAGSRVSYRNVIGVNVPGEPINGSTGLVLLNFEDNTRVKVGVKFDKYFQGGNDLGGIC
ncbi:uncharacterized protein LOC131595828 [Vicia villosa]|uniref:uncharacterized protein LOC131595828 n=1 Tax=Vicia villosa TaxID=3911 RepID=UPI00273AC7C1|nr:uncharacterized protein LOC131595828 [Vicia villosa]